MEIDHTLCERTAIVPIAHTHAYYIKHILHGHASTQVSTHHPELADQLSSVLGPGHQIVYLLLHIRLLVRHI